MNSNTVIKNTIFDGNISQGPNTVGGGVYNVGGTSTIENCLFTYNSGGAICADGNVLNLKNTTITKNSAGILDRPSGMYIIGCSPFISNSIIYDNQGLNIGNIAANPTFAYSDVQGSGAPGNWNPAFGINYGANIDSDPLFTSDFKLTTCSPALNTGTGAFGLNPTDLAGNNRSNSSSVDMGAYEFHGIEASAYGPVIYVDALATGSKTGLSWADAFTDLQNAIDISKCAQASQIWVSKGTYYPTKDVLGRLVNDATATFQMRNNLTIIGGFSVADGVTTLAGRNWKNFRTKLSGDLTQIGGLVKAYNVINNYNNGVNNTAVLDGFTIEKAFNNANALGGGVINANTSPSFLNCTFFDNYAAGHFTARGGAMHNEQNASPIITNCEFLYNGANGIDNAFGAAISNDNSSPIISRSIFIGNIVSAPNAAGGGIYSNGGNPVLVNNSLFKNNNGAAICADGNNMELNNLSITLNTSTTTSVAGGLCFINSNANIYNSIIHDNTGGSVHVYSGIPTFAYSDIGGSGAPANWNTAFGINYGANIDINPNWDANQKPYLCSPTVNGGTAAFGLEPLDLAGNTRIYGTVVDMGAYESVASTQSTASASICAGIGNFYLFHNQQFSTAGQYTILLPGAAVGGCDSSVVLTLTVNTPTPNVTNVAICGTSYTWPHNGQTYTQSGLYIGNVNTNCVEERLNLTITPVTNNITNVSACGTSYFWANNFVTYTASGTYYEIYGCHTETLNLTLTPNTENVVDVIACGLYTWENNGQTYTQSGIYTGSTIDCVIQKLNLTVTPYNTNTTTITACGSYLWSVNNQTFTQSGTYIFQNGCVTETLHLTIYDTPGAALDFDGINDYAQTLHSSSLNYTQFTIEVWIKWDRPSGGLDFITSKGLNFMEIHTGGGSPNNLRFIPVPGVILDAGANALPSGVWVHLAAVYHPAAGLAKLYVNGVDVPLTLSGPNPLTTPIPANTQEFILGARISKEFPFKGQMDEFRVWNRALSQVEIQANMHCEIAETACGLVLNQHINNGLALGNNTGNTALNDNSGNANNAALINFNLMCGANTSNFVAPGAVTSGTSCNIDPILQSSPGNVPITWTGLMDTNWNNACNWSPIWIPDLSNLEVIVPLTNNKLTINNSANIKKMTAQLNTEINISPGVILNVVGRE